MRKLAFTLALLAATPALASTDSFETDPAFMPTLRAFQSCMANHVGNGDEDPYVRMERAFNGPCARYVSEVVSLAIRHHTAPENSPYVLLVYAKASQPFFDSAMAALSIRKGVRLPDNPHPCQNCAGK